MKNIKVLDEKYEYRGGVQVATITTETTVTLSDAVAELGNYQIALSRQLADVDYLKAQQKANPKLATQYDSELIRLANEIKLLRQAITVQNQHIKKIEESIEQVDGEVS
jgi:phage shock protein A